MAGNRFRRRRALALTAALTAAVLLVASPAHSDEHFAGVYAGEATVATGIMQDSNFSFVVRPGGEVTGVMRTKREFLLHEGCDIFVIEIEPGQITLTDRGDGVFEAAGDVWLSRGDFARPCPAGFPLEGGTGGVPRSPSPFTVSWSEGVLRVSSVESFITGTGVKVADIAGGAVDTTTTTTTTTTAPTATTEPITDDELIVGISFGGTGAIADPVSPLMPRIPFVMSVGLDTALRIAGCEGETTETCQEGAALTGARNFVDDVGRPDDNARVRELVRQTAQVIGLSRLNTGDGRAVLPTVHSAEPLLRRLIDRVRSGDPQAEAELHRIASEAAQLDLRSWSGLDPNRDPFTARARFSLTGSRTDGDDSCRGMHALTRGMSGVLTFSVDPPNGIVTVSGADTSFDNVSFVCEYDGQSVWFHADRMVVYQIEMAGSYDAATGGVSAAGRITIQVAMVDFSCTRWGAMQEDLFGNPPPALDCSQLGSSISADKEINLGGVLSNIPDGDSNAGTTGLGEISIESDPPYSIHGTFRA